MNLKILFASFIVVFLAELGDKTQLTALAFTTSSKSPLTVFVGTSLALIAASAMAVLAGQGLMKIPVVEKYLPIASATMFIVIGLVLLVNIARKVEPVTAEELSVEDVEAAEDLSALPTGGALFSFIAHQAAILEQNTINSLEEIYAALPDGQEKETLAALIAEDKRHLETLDGMPEEHEATFDAEETQISQQALRDLNLDKVLLTAEPVSVTDSESDTGKLIQKAIDMEESIADTYLAFARLAKVHTVRDAFRWLAMEEIRHADTLCDLINPPENTESLKV